jgi:hypothetical protein
MAVHQAVIMVALLGAGFFIAAPGLGLGGHHRIASFALALGHGVPTKPIGGEGRGKLITHGELPLGDIYLCCGSSRGTLGRLRGDLISAAGKS